MVTAIYHSKLTDASKPANKNGTRSIKVLIDKYGVVLSSPNRNTEKYTFWTERVSSSTLTNFGIKLVEILGNVWANLLKISAAVNDSQGSANTIIPRSACSVKHLAVKHDMEVIP